MRISTTIPRPTPRLSRGVLAANGWLPPVLAALVASCAPQARTIEVPLSPTAQVLAPSYVPEGTRLDFVVTDPAYRNVYGADSTLTALASVSRAALHGAAEIGKLSGDIPSGIFSASAPKATQEAGQVPNGTRRYPAAARGGAFDDSPRSRLQALLRLDSIALARASNAATRTKTVVAKLDSLLLDQTGQAALLSFMADRHSHELARTLAADPTPEAVVKALGDAALGVDSLPVPEAELRLTLDAAELYGRKVGVLSAALPANTDPLSHSARTALADLNAATHDYRQWRDSSIALARSARALARVEGLGEPVPGSVAALPSLRAAGVDISPLVGPEAAGLGGFATVRGDLLSIERQTERMVRAANELPEWTRATSPTRRVLSTQVYGDTLLTVAVLRTDRPGEFQFANPQAAPSGTTDAAKKNGAAAAGSGASPSTGSLPAIGTVQQRRVDTVAVVRVPVVRRYRLQLGAGLLYSRMHRDLFETKPDTSGGEPGVFVRGTGTERSRVAPMVFLSYTLLPLSGKVVDGRAYDAAHGWRDRLALAGLTTQAGVSMAKPTEELYLGLGTEPVPGINVGWGVHARYSEVSDNAGRFVADSSETPATQKRWLRSFRTVTVSVDGDVFARTLAKLWGS